MVERKTYPPKTVIHSNESGVEMIFFKNNHHPIKGTEANKKPQHAYQRNNSSTSSFFYHKKHVVSRVSPFQQNVFCQKKSPLSPSSWASPDQTARNHSCYKDRFRWPIVGNQTSKSCQPRRGWRIIPERWRNTLLMVQKSQGQPPFGWS